MVDVTLTDLTTATTVGTQQFVLYAGTAPFTYAGFTGPATTADAYQVTVSAEASHADGGQSWPAGSSVPTAKVVDSQLEVVDPTNPQYLATAYAPVMYGRSTSALHDVPLVVDATATPASGGATDLSYTFIWSHEDAGTGFVPFLESGTWGRMTDIENAISFTVNADGTTSNASYLWGGEPATGFPDSQGALQEVDEPFNGQWDGNHPVLRDATGNNDFSTSGTTPFRFQLAPVPGPAAGQTRESVMDANPFTYEISGQEVDRWYTDVSTVHPVAQHRRPAPVRHHRPQRLGHRGHLAARRAPALRGPDLVRQRLRHRLPGQRHGALPDHGQAPPRMAEPDHHRGPAPGLPGVVGIVGGGPLADRPGPAAGLEPHHRVRPDADGGGRGHHHSDPDPPDAHHRHLAERQARQDPQAAQGSGDRRGR